MTIILIKDGLIVSDSATTMYQGSYNSFNVKKGMFFDPFYVVGCGKLADIQRSHEIVENSIDNGYTSTEIAKTISKEINEDSEIILFDKEQPSILFSIRKDYVEKVPREFSYSSGIQEMYWKALLDYDMNPLQVIQHVMNNNFINYVSYPFFVFSMESGKESILHEDGTVEEYSD